jgi:hypothetical protein
MYTRKQTIRRPDTGGPGQTGIGVPNGGVFPTRPIHHQEIPVQSVKVAFDANFEVTAAGAGAADGQGLKLLTLPAGRKVLIGTLIEDLVATTQAGLTGASVNFSLGTAAANSDADLADSGEANALGSLTIGDGTLAAGAAESEADTAYLGASGTIALIGTNTGDEVSIYLNVAGTFTHASDTLCDLRVQGSLELFYIDLGAAF